MEKSAKLIHQDHAHIWHPFTQMQTTRSFIPIVRGKGSYLYTEDGKSFLDATSSWWVNLHGHAHPYIAKKIQVQSELLEHLSFADFTHPTAIELAVRLLPLLPGTMSKIFYSDNGSTATEAALKMAIQYWYNQNPKIERPKVVCFKGSYHGDTFGAMSASGKSALNRPFWKQLFAVDSIDPPLIGQEEKSLEQLSTILAREETACFIFEPLILGVGGMVIYPQNGLASLLKMCREHNVLTIADEVMTGFGRTGPLFACEKFKENIDLICLAKGLTGGFLPLAITACQTHVFNAFLSNERQDAFLHGHSYTANPLACASALASLDLLQEKSCSLQREKIRDSHHTFCQKWKDHPKVARCESIGTILVLEYRTKDPSCYFQHLRDQLYYFFLDRGVLLRPLGNVLYVMPPYCIQLDELKRIYALIVLTLEGPL